MLPDNFLEELPVNNHKVLPTFSCDAFNKLRNDLAANKTRSWPAELIGIILLYWFYPLENSSLFPRHMLFLI